jgi:hypothetical protein
MSQHSEEPNMPFLTPLFRWMGEAVSRLERQEIRNPSIPSEKKRSLVSAITLSIWTENLK